MICETTGRGGQLDDDAMASSILELIPELGKACFPRQRKGKATRVS